MKSTRVAILCAALLLLCLTCKKPFQPATVNGSSNFLVVEGVINSGADTTLIKLSRTAKLTSTTIQVETGATVQVQGDDQSIYLLSEIRPGTYYAVGLNLPTTHKYRLHIATGTEEFASDFIENKTTPSIDTLTFKVQSAGVQLYINAHDATNSTRYYRWDYDETWNYYSANVAYITFDKTTGQIEQLGVNDLINQCYKFATPSNSIVISSSAKLTSDVIYQAPLAYVDANSGKLAHIYSILVRQYALTPEAYTYWQDLKKNTEQLGSIFDAQPSTSGGNVHCLSNPKEPAIGFVSVSTITSHRYFIQSFQLQGLNTPQGPSACMSGASTLPVDPMNTLLLRLHATFDKGDTLLINEIHDRVTNALIGYSYAPSVCVDCRLAGGTNVKPPYWPF